MSKEQESYNAAKSTGKVLANSSGPTKMHYITLEDGTDFRKIAQIMSDAGYQMNHATARNVLMLSLSNLFKSIAEDVGTEVNEVQIKNMLKDQSVHEALSDVLFEAYEQLQEDEAYA